MALGMPGKHSATELQLGQIFLTQHAFLSTVLLSLKYLLKNIFVLNSFRDFQISLHSVSATLPLLMDGYRPGMFCLEETQP